MHVKSFLPQISSNCQIIIALWSPLAGQKDCRAECKKQKPGNLLYEWVCYYVLEPALHDLARTLGVPGHSRWGKMTPYPVETVTPGNSPRRVRSVMGCGLGSLFVLRARGEQTLIYNWMDVFESVKRQSHLFYSKCCQESNDVSNFSHRETPLFRSTPLKML